jgi:hypothetical protein
VAEYCLLECGNSKSYNMPFEGFRRHSSFFLTCVDHPYDELFFVAVTLCSLHLNYGDQFFVASAIIVLDSF